MRGQVDDHAHVADPRRERAQAAGEDVKHAAELTGRDPALQLADRGVEALDVADREDALRALRGVDQRLAFLQRVRDRLLDQDVDAALQRRHADVAMEARRNRHDHGIQPAGVQHLPPRLITGHAVLLAGLRNRFGTLVADSDQLGAFDRAQHSEVVPTHDAAPGYADANHAPVTASRTAPTIRVRSASLSPGWTGSDSTCSATRSQEYSVAVSRPQPRSRYSGCLWTGMG